MPREADHGGAAPGATRPPAALSHAMGFVRRYWVRIAVTSAVLLMPCFWHRRIQAGDLASHVYNAWLAPLIQNGEAPGLWMAAQWHNVLFDHLLSWLVALTGFEIGERVAVSLTVLVLFWGAFAVVGAATGRAPWLLMPGLGMVAYGWTFQAGFFNYYLAVGVSLFAIALFWRGEGWERGLALAVGAPLICLAHAVGLVWFAAATAYIAGTQRLARRHRVILPLLAAGLVLATAAYLRTRYRTIQAFGPPGLFNGADQFFLFGHDYLWIVAATLLVGVVAVIADAVGHRVQLWARYGIPLQLYGLALLGALVLPSVIFLPQYPAPVALLVERFTLVSAILACVLLGAARPRIWHAVALGVIAACFAALLYRDTARIDHLEDQARRLVATLPPRSRVLGTVYGPEHSRVWVHHLVARACIGKCFAYGNYEPASGQFRVRARAGNRVALTDIADVGAAESGAYVVRPEDLPVFQVYQCGPGSRLCIAELSAGAPNNAVAHRQ